MALTLEPSQHIRFRIPLPRDPLKFRLGIKATFCIFTPIDPEDSLNYTRAGLGIVFRPKTIGDPGKNSKGKPRSVHQSGSFLHASNYYPTELQRRNDAHKWEAVLRDEGEFEPDELNQPVFDVEHHARMNGQPAARRTDIPYGLIVTLSSRNEPNLYNRILAAYPNVLEILNPTIQLQINR